MITDARNIICNTVVQSNNWIGNFIVLLVKFYVYRQRCMKGNLNIKAFIRFVREIENIEKYIAIKNDKIRLHCKKWKKDVRL